PGRVILRQLKANHSSCIHDIVSSDFSSCAIPFLIDDRLPLSNLSRGGFHHQIALGIHSDAASAAKPEPYVRGICARRYYKVVFEFMLVAIVDEIDSRIDALAF